jgi:adenylate cyclase class 2
MSLEIEAKMKVDDLDEVIPRLQSAGAVYVGEHQETNTFFDTPDGRLREADKGLRIRANMDTRTKQTEHIVTFKGPRQPGAVKTRLEIEFTVSDPAAATQTFEQLGFPVCITFQKRRRSWRLLQCKIELDELPNLGTFVEIEGPSEKQVLKARKALGLDDQPIITTSYAAMMSAFLEAHSKQVR